MNSPRLKYPLMALIFLILTVTTSAHADEDFEATKKLAESGDGIAQFNLALMYANGDGVPKNDKEAVKWYRKSAEQGHAKAQGNLGVMYYTGDGVPKNNILAHKWLNLARVGGASEAGKNLKILTPKMTKEQIAEAQKLATEWYEAHQK